MSVYILHFSSPLHHARHYVGFSDGMRNLKRRVAHHQNKTANCSITRAAVEAGIELILAKTYPKADRTFERSLKLTGNTKHYCPICNPNAPEYHPRKVRTYDSVARKYVEAEGGTQEGNPSPA